MKIENMSVEQLEQMLAEKKKKEVQKQERAQKKYLKEKDDTVEDLFTAAKDLHLALARFKGLVHLQMEKQAEATANYGLIPTNSKGGFSLTHSNGDQRIIRRRDTDPTWDERGDKGVELVREFLFDYVKKRDLEMFEILLSFIERNNNGDLEYQKVMELFQHENKFNDPRWIEGLRLVKESYKVVFKAFGYEFKEKNAHGKWARLELNFASL